MKTAARSPDFVLLAAVLMLVVTGVIMVFSASTSRSYTVFGHPWHFITRHIMWTMLGAIAMYLTSRINYRHWRTLANFGLAATLILLLAVWVPGLGVTVQGSSRWVDIGPIRMQPSELAKVTLIIWLADKLAKRPLRLIRFFRGTLPLLCVAGVVGGLIFRQPDLGTAVAVVLVYGVVMFAGGLPIGQMLALGAGAGVLFSFLVRSAPYRLERLVAFWDPWKDPLDTGYQIIQSWLAIGTGGLAGLGWGQGRQKRFFLPEPHNDFIFSTVAEELGFIGAGVLILLFVVLAVRGIRIASQTPDRFGSLLAIGITSMVVTQAMINLAVVTGSVPVTGITLPLVSYGGSSLIIVMASLGMLLNISKHVAPQEKG